MPSTLLTKWITCIQGELLTEFWATKSQPNSGAVGPNFSIDITWWHLILLIVLVRNDQTICFVTGSFRRPPKVAGGSLKPSKFCSQLFVGTLCRRSQNGKSGCIIIFIFICSFNVCHCARTILHIPREWWLFIGCLSCQLTGKIFDSSTNLFTHFETFSDNWNVFRTPLMSIDRQNIW